MRRARYFPVAIAAVFALAACGEEVLDVDKGESEVAPELERQTGTRSVSVDCPEEVEIEDGGTFECGVSTEGGVEAKVEVTQTDDEGNVRWELVQP
jgi:hypothetical protein